MTHEPQTERSFGRFSSVNWIGLVAGVLMLIVPFRGAWWRAVVGTGALKMSFSPFYYEVVFAGQEITSQLVGFFILAAQLTVLVGGGLMIVGSLTATRWWGKRLVEWGSMKVVWMLVSIIVLVVLGALFANEFLPSLLSSFGGEETSTQFSLPYLIGSGQAEIVVDGKVTINAPMTAELTSSFWLTVVAAIFGVGAKIYHGRLMNRIEV